MKNKSDRKGQKAQPSVQALTDFESPMTDPQGSYTGCPAHLWETPVQDADDL